jgi:hypothetical protein
MMYHTFPDEPCWYVYASWDDNLIILRSSRVIVISRMTGQSYTMTAWVMRGEMGVQYN